MPQPSDRLELDHHDISAVGGDCFQKAANLLLNPERVPGSELLEGVHVLGMAHGVVTGRGPVHGVRFSHAWLIGARDGIQLAIDLSNGCRFVGPSELYYAIGNVDADDVCFYTPEEARRHLVDHGHYGPWEGAAMAIGL